MFTHKIDTDDEFRRYPDDECFEGGDTPQQVAQTPKREQVLMTNPKLEGDFKDVALQIKELCKKEAKKYHSDLLEEVKVEISSKDYDKGDIQILQEDWLAKNKVTKLPKVVDVKDKGINFTINQIDVVFVEE